jgi:hypothetical protein
MEYRGKIESDNSQEFFGLFLLKGTSAVTSIRLKRNLTGGVQ